jgi:predicted nucleic-acid-binding Zn-ribbon protein
MKCRFCGCKNFEAKMIVLKDRPKYADVQNGVWRCMQCQQPYVQQEKKEEEKHEDES